MWQPIVSHIPGSACGPFHHAPGVDPVHGGFFVRLAERSAAERNSEIFPALSIPTFSPLH